MVGTTKKGYFFWFIIVAAITFLVDQATKLIVFYTQPNFNLLFLKIQYLTNTGAGFGLFPDQTGLLTIISVLVTVFIVYFYNEIPQQKWPQIFSAFFLGGVIGNLMDRLFRGFVIDFINFRIWPTFNVADTAITIGIIGMIITLWSK